MNSALAALLVADPLLEAVKTAIASYAGLAALVVALVGALKTAFPAWTRGKEPFLGLVLTYVTGIAAKLAMPAIYGPHTVESWSLHALCLLVVAVGAKGIHDGVVNALRRLKDEDDLTSMPADELRKLKAELLLRITTVDRLIREREQDQPPPGPDPEVKP